MCYAERYDVGTAGWLIKTVQDIKGHLGLVREKGESVTATAPTAQKGGAGVSIHFDSVQARSPQEKQHGWSVIESSALESKQAASSCTRRSYPCRPSSVNNHVIEFEFNEVQNEVQMCSMSNNEFFNKNNILAVLYFGAEKRAEYRVRRIINIIGHYHLKQNL